MATDLGAIEVNMKEQSYIIEFIFNEGIKLYNIMIYNDIDYAIKRNNKLLFFENVYSAKRFVANSLKQNLLPGDAISLSCNLPLAINTIRKKAIDRNSIILNCINTFDDLLKSIDQKYPAIYKKPLFRFADHLTFKKSLQPFFDKSGYKKDTLIKALNSVQKIVLLNSIVHIETQNRRKRYISVSEYFSQLQSGGGKS